jgi:hypothetical protein
MLAEYIKTVIELLEKWEYTQKTNKIY